MSKPFSRHDDDPVEGAPADTAGGPSSGYVALGDIALLSQAPLSSELDPPGGGDDPAPSASAAESEPKSETDAELEVAEATAEETSVESTVEALISDLERVTNERDGYLDDTRRLAAEFANFRRQTEKRHLEVVEQAAASLVERLLPVLDACDGALAHGAADVEPIYAMLVSTLEKAGLTVMRPLGEQFDPNCHDAVIHEDGDGDGPHVAEVLRTGYEWNGRVLRPALVKVRD